MITGDIEHLYAEYLFPLARICHLGAREIGQLRLQDFALYIDAIDAYLAELNKIQKGA